MQRTLLSVATRPRPAIPSSLPLHPATFDYVAPICRAIRGMVRDKATGKPVAGVKVNAWNSIHMSLTDNAGGYEILVSTPSPGWNLIAKPESGQPYFAASAWVPDKPGPDAILADFDLVSGILLHGRVTDQATRQPPKAAVVEYYPLFPNAHSSKITNGFFVAASSSAVQPDGSYRLVALPGPGVLCVAASPHDRYAVAMVDEKELAALVKDGISPDHGRKFRTAVGKSGHWIVWVIRYNAVSLINPEEGAASLALDLPLQPARPLNGTVIGPDGKSLTRVNVVGLTAFKDDELLESASFTISGLNPRGTRTLFFHQRAQELGKAVTIGGDETEPLTVQLEPCGSVIGRVVDKAGKPVPGLSVSLGGQDTCLATQAATDRQGRFRVALVPGQKYGFRLNTPRPLPRNVEPVEVESGRITDLGDLSLGD
jgi:hypothetical protein